MAMRRKQTDRRRRRFGGAASYRRIPVPDMTMVDEFPVYKRFLPVKFSGSGNSLTLTPQNLVQLDQSAYGSRSDATTHRFYSVRLDSVTVWQYSATDAHPITVKFFDSLSSGGVSSTGSSVFSCQPQGSNATEAMCCLPDTTVAGRFYGHNEDRKLCIISREGGDASYGIRVGVSFR